MNTSKLSLIGAGPGDPELITLKAINALKAAEVVLYDALVNPELLSYTRPSAELIYVGKRAGNHYKTQDEINALIGVLSHSYGHVARLKGGDPFVFGRGWEEYAFAVRSGIEVEVIPGLTSALAVPGINQIPLTLRGVTDSVLLVSGSSFIQERSQTCLQAVEAKSTVVVLMGLGVIDQIARTLLDALLSDVPIAVIQEGSLPGQKLVKGSAIDIVAKVSEAQLSTPAIVIIGPVVALSELLSNSKAEVK